MAIFNEGFIDKLIKSKSKPSKSLPKYRYETTKAKFKVGDKEDSSEFSRNGSPKESLEYFVDLLYDAEINGSSISLSKRNLNKIESDNDTIYVYKLKVNEFVPGNNESGVYKCTVEKIEASGTCIEVLEKYGFHITGSDNASNIEKAKKAVKNLKNLWEMNACIHGYYEGPEFVIHENGGNIEIQAISNDLNKLIDGCMAFASEMAR